MMLGSMATRSPMECVVTEGWAAMMTPADSWPRMCESVTIIGPMAPWHQKWMSELMRGDVSGLCFHRSRAGQGETNPQMPVLLIATVTSPSSSEEPLWTSSSEGSASATQRSCLGLVQTPMLALVALVSVVVVVEDIVMAVGGVVAGRCV